MTKKYMQQILIIIFMYYCHQIFFYNLIVLENLASILPVDPVKNYHIIILQIIWIIAD